ncbi:YciI family protein [Sulfuricurvum sp.]|uniref:YciI family protein n=1 Tax=Sulfuricurvum sp. TaxID=2025608 RepID=UPI00263334FE|nr:YciI family protein [Sulfuricurvum sp.]MDD2266863.1 YciI family protein [Sulfuricurvum sp.]MDD2783832.1 YciI family protein [Sulfuricurvum sp.]
MKPLEAVDALLDEHVAYLKEQYALGNFLASRCKVPRTGGVILVHGASSKVIEDILSPDPFYSHGMVEYEITEFCPTMTSHELSFLKE